MANLLDTVEEIKSGLEINVLDSFDNLGSYISRPGMKVKLGEIRDKSRYDWRVLFDTPSSNSINSDAIYVAFPNKTPASFLGNAISLIPGFGDRIEQGDKMVRRIYAVAVKSKEQR